MPTQVKETFNKLFQHALGMQKSKKNEEKSEVELDPKVYTFAPEVSPMY